MFGKMFGRKKHAAPWGKRPAVEDAPRMKIKATAKDADRLLKAYDERRTAEDAPTMNEPHMPKWWE